jgi:hypothetical protein
MDHRNGDLPLTRRVVCKSLLIPLKMFAAKTRKLRLTAETSFLMFCLVVAMQRACYWLRPPTNEIWFSLTSIMN